MDKNENKQSGFATIGLIANLLGTILLARSAFEYTGQIITSVIGNEYHPLFLEPILFQISLSLIITGFFLQVLDSFWNKIPEKYLQIRLKWIIFYSLSFFTIALMFYAGMYWITGIF